MRFLVRERGQAIDYDLINSDFSIIADKAGVRICGFLENSIKNEGELLELETVLRWAFRQHLSLKDHGMIISQDSLSQELQS